MKAISIIIALVLAIGTSTINAQNGSSKAKTKAEKIEKNVRRETKSVVNKTSDVARKVGPGLKHATYKAKEEAEGVSEKIKDQSGEKDVSNKADSEKVTKATKKRAKRLTEKSI